eukprot:Opistho-2@53682
MASKIFINHVETFTGRAIAKKFHNQIVGFLAKDDDSGDEAETNDSENDVKEELRYEVVGTLRDPDADVPKWVKEPLRNISREALRDVLLKCDVIIYDICEQIDQVEEALWAVEVLRKESENFDRKKVFVCLSTVLTWARTKVDRDEPDAPFTEDDYRRRKAHPNFRPHLNCEKAVVKAGKGDRSKLSTFVVATGLTYGCGENIFHFLFKSAWHGDPQELHIFGRGDNVVPTIHIEDLASSLHHIVDRQPESRYIVCVDDSKNSLEEVVKCISSNLGTGKTKKISKEDALLTKDLEQANYDMLLVDVRLDSTLIKDFKFEWVSEEGIIDNIDAIIAEYRTVRNLHPLRIMIHGPPASGKSYFAARLCSHYKLHHIRVQDVINDALRRLATSAGRVGRENGGGGDGDEDEEEANAQAEADKELLEELRESARDNAGRYSDEHVVQFFRDKLSSMPCRNQGYVLDGFPKTIEQAQELFKLPEGESYDDAKRGDPNNIMPEYVLALEASDDFLKERVMNLPEAEVAGTHNTEDGLLRRLQSYRQSNTEDDTVLNFFDEREVHPIILKSDDEPTKLFEEMSRAIGQPHNYGPTAEELAEINRLTSEERSRREAVENEERERREAEEAADRSKKEAEWKSRLEEVKRQEQEVLEAQSIPLRNYLMKHVMPTLTKGLIEVCKSRPEDPIDFLAEYLFSST